MYNQYIPPDTSYQWVGEQPDGPPEPPSFSTPTDRTHPLSFLERWGEQTGLFRRGDGEEKGLMALFRRFHLDELDSGDILILLIAALLFREKKDVDLAIALVLVFLFDFGGSHSAEQTT